MMMKISTRIKSSSSNRSKSSRFSNNKWTKTTTTTKKKIIIVRISVWLKCLLLVAGIPVRNSSSRIPILFKVPISKREQPVIVLFHLAHNNNNNSMEILITKKDNLTMKMTMMMISMSTKTSMGIRFLRTLWESISSACVKWGKILMRNSITRMAMKISLRTMKMLNMSIKKVMSSLLRWSRN